MKPILSVIMPIYNSELYLKQAIDSVLNQTFRDLELILIDDGSTDNSGRICDEYSLKDNRITVYHKRNEGQGVARNLGISKASGKYITFLDSDDFIDPITYESVIASSEANKLDINRFCYSQFHNSVDTEISTDYKQPTIYQDIRDIRQIALCLFSRPLDKNTNDYNLGGSSCCAIYTSSLIKDNNIQFPNNKEFVCEDIIFNYYCLQQAKKVGKSQTVFYHYRINPVSTTHKPNIKVVDKCINTCIYLEKKLSEDGYPMCNTSYIKGFMVENIRSYLKNIFTSDMKLKDKLSWVENQANAEYIKHIYNSYEWRKLHLKHRIHWWAFATQKSCLLYLIVVGQEKLRLAKRFISNNA